MKGCIFCQAIEKNNYEIETQYFVIRLDEFPVTYGHSLIIPKRHVTKIEKLTDNELIDFKKAILNAKNNIIKDDSVSGFNYGVNEGEIAGQTKLHLHFHVIPRRKGDVENPEGGIRNIFPGKGAYTHKEKR